MYVPPARLAMRTSVHAPALVASRVLLDPTIGHSVASQHRGGGGVPQHTHTHFCFCCIAIDPRNGPSLPTKKPGYSVKEEEDRCCCIFCWERSVKFERAVSFSRSFYFGTAIMVTSPSSSPPQPAEEHPLAVARDRIQASAREMIRNLEAAMQNAPSSPSTPETTKDPVDAHANSTTATGSLEHAFRLFFSSCTTGATVLAEDGTQGGDEDDDTAADLTPVSTLPSSHDSASSLSSRSPPTTTTKQVTTTSQQPSSQSNRSVSAPPRRPAPTSNKTVTRTRSSNHDVFREPTLLYSSTPPIANHVYEQLFLDEQRQQKQKDAAPPLPREPSHTNDPHSTSRTAEDANAIIIQHPQQYDDEISAISAHTLEAMAYHPHHFYQGGGGGGSLERHLSAVSTDGSSLSTFDQWQQAEQSYWAQQIVRKERRARRRLHKQQQQTVQEMAEI